MGSRKKIRPPLQSESDIDVEDFARQFFGTQEKFDHTPKDNENDRRKPKGSAKYRKEIIPDTREDKLYNYTTGGSDIQIGNRASTTGPKSLEGKKSLAPSRHAPAADLKQLILTRFLDLRTEFHSLSESLDKISMSKVSKRLTQVLAERQRLMAMLLEMGEAPGSALGYSDDKRQYRKFHNQPRLSEERGFGISKRTKNVHWSDEHLGGSIVQDPTVEVRNPVDLQQTLQVSSNWRHKNSLEFSEDLPVLFQHTRSLGQQEINEVDHRQKDKPPPSYRVVDSFTQTQHRRRSRKESRCDTQGSLCSLEIGHAIGWVDEIANEAAALRCEACCMLWRAHYLEQLCDANGIVKHVYYSSSDVPALPRYPHLHQDNY